MCPAAGDAPGHETRAAPLRTAPPAAHAPAAPAEFPAPKRHERAGARVLHAHSLHSPFEPPPALLLRRSERRLWLLPWMLLCHMLVSMVMVVIGVELRHSSRVYVVVREMVLYHGEPQGVVEEVMLMVVVMGPKQRERYRHEARGRWHRE